MKTKIGCSISLVSFMLIIGSAPVTGQSESKDQLAIKRKAYGFHDLRYFTLKIYQAFAN